MTRRVLVIDDADDIRAVARMSLERLAGWEVTEAATGEDGLAAAATEQPDAVLLDVVLPRLDGPATFARLQADERTRDIPVLLLTARAEPADRDRWLADGVSGVLTKPFDPVQLPTEIAAALGWPA